MLNTDVLLINMVDQKYTSWEKSHSIIVPRMGVARECRGCRCNPMATKNFFTRLVVEMMQNGLNLVRCTPADERKI